VNKIIKTEISANNIFKVFVFVIFSFLFLITFFIYSDFDGQYSYNQQNTFFVSNVSNTHTKKEYLNYIQKIANNTHENIYLKSHTSSGDGAFYSFIGNQDKHNKLFPNNIYPSFNKSDSITFLKGTQSLNSDLRTYYLTSANKATTNLIIAKFNSYGLDATHSNGIIGTKLSVLTLIMGATLDNTFTFLFIMLMLSSLFVLFFINSKNIVEYSIKATNGWSKSRIFLKSFKSILKTFLFSIITMFIVFTIVSFFYSGFNQYSSFLILLFQIFLSAVVFIFIFYFIFFIIVFNKKNIYSVIKGKNNTTKLFAICLVVQILILFVVFFNVVQIFNNYKVVTENKQNFQKFDSIKNFKSINWGMSIVGNINKKTGEIQNNNTNQKLISNFIIKMIDNNKAFYVERNGVNLGDLPDCYGMNCPTIISNSLIVTNLFLSKQNIYNTNNKVINNLKIDNNTTYILIPENKKNIEQSIIKHVKQYFMDAQDLSIFKVNIKNIKIKTIYLKANQTISNFNNGDDLNTGNSDINLPTAVNYDPIILVVSPTLLYNTTNSFSVYYNGNSNLQQDLQKYKVDKLVYEINSVYNVAITQIDKLSIKEFNDLIGILLSLLILIISSVMMLFTYCDSNKQMIFSKFINGFSISTIFSLLCSSVFLANIFVLLFYVITHKTVGLNNILICLYIILLNIIVQVLSARYYFKQIKADYVKRY
jgi:hypothetical protein